MIQFLEIGAHYGASSLMEFALRAAIWTSIARAIREMPWIGVMALGILIVAVVTFRKRA